ncbi:MAG TPA: rhodanese-like domain-containing protein [Pyrinomonadaceae bacterium]|nr:rhodanese-like domain-containing protein [Pyrinomonadaceae bacterium]
MRLFLLFIAVSTLGIVALTACNSNEFKSARTTPGDPQANAPLPPDGARRVTLAELKGMLERNEAVVIDVRNQASFDQGHIRGARLIPEAELGNHLSELPSNKLIVTYCS